MQLKIWKWLLNFSLSTAPDRWTTGITNETEDNYFVPFIDYDDILLAKVRKDIQHLQKVFGLGSAVILSTKQEIINNEEYGNYHVVFFDKLPHNMIQYVIGHTHADKKYSTHWRLLYQKNWVLRITEKRLIKGNKIIRNKPWFVDTVPGTSQHEKSLAHYLFFANLYKFKPTENRAFDNSENVDIINYQTGDA